MPNYSDLAGVTDDFLINGKLTVDGLFLRTYGLTSTSNLTAIDANKADIFTITLTENTTFQNPTGTFVDGQLILINIKSATSYTIAFGTDFEVASSLVLPSATTGSNKIDSIAFRRSTAQTKWIFIGTTIGQIPTAADGSITPAKLAQPMTSGTALATTSGTSVGYTGIPSWARKISLLLEGVSISAADNIYIRIGDSGGLETTGYVGASGSVAFSVAFGISSGSAANVWSGVFELFYEGSNTWVGKGVFATGSVTLVTAGHKTLSDTLTQIYVVAPSGAFDAGNINIIYE